MFKFSVSQIVAACASLSAGFILSTSAAAVSPEPLATVKTSAQRIVVMDFGALDTLVKLGQEHRIVALPQDNIPQYLERFKAKDYGNTGGMKEPDLKLIDELKPDFIIISGRQGKSLPELVKVAPTVQWSVDGKDYLASFKQTVRDLASVVDQKDAAEAALSEIDQKVAEVRAKASASEARAVVMIHNAGKLRPMNQSQHATLIHEVLGVKRADPSEEAPSRDVVIDINDYLAQYKPEIIFVIDRSAAINDGGLDAALWETDKIKSIPAYQNKKIIVLTPDLWYLSGHGLESLALQIDDVAAALN